MFNWLFDSDGVATNIIDKLVSGEKLGRLAAAIVAVAVAYFLANYIPVLAGKCLTGVATGTEIALLVGATLALLVAVGTAWYNFARWISRSSDHSNTDTLAEAARDATIASHRNKK